MDPATLAARLDEVQLVDVREDDEWAAGHIDGAVHIPEHEVADRVGELDRGRPVVTVCRVGARSQETAEWLRQQGFGADSLDGGLLAWKWAGLALTGPIVEPPPKPDQDPMDIQAFHDELIEIATAAQERFGPGVEPTAEQMFEFLRDRLISEGKTPEEADAFLAQMGED